MHQVDNTFGRKEVVSLLKKLQKLEHYQKVI